MKNQNLFVLASSLIMLTLNACHPARDYSACISACQNSEDVVISTYEHCLAVAAEVKNNKLLGTAEFPGCFSMAGEAKANCIQMANSEYQENVRQCKATFDRDLLEARKCTLKCLQTGINENRQN